MIPALPRNDPDHVEGSESPLATAAWMESTAIVTQHATILHGDNAGDDILVGRLQDNDGQTYYIGYNDDRHLITVAGSRSGKGTAQIIPNLLHYRHNIVVIDPKGENANASALYRKSMGHRIAIFDPYKVCDEELSKYRVSYNPLSSLDPDDPEIIEDATGIADALILRGKQTTDPHWEETARMVVRALILYVLIRPKQTSGAPTLSDVLYYLNEGVIDPEEELRFLNAQDKENIPEYLKNEPKNFENLIKSFQAQTQFNGAISSVGYALADMGDRERGSVLSTVRRNLDFLISPAMQNVLERSDIHIDDLRDPHKPTSIYLVLPEYRMGTHSRWLRLMITSLLHALQRDGVGMAGKPKTETLFILDEFASLGYLDAIERATSYIAGFGVKLWTILQDLNQLKDIYDKRWETFIGNCGVLTAFANTDTTTLDYLSKRLGDTEIVKTEISRGRSGSQNVSKAGLGAVVKELISEKGEPASVLGASSLQDGSGYSYNENPKAQTTALIRADEIAHYFARKPKEDRDQEMLLCLMAGQQPMRLQKCFYYSDEELNRRSKIK